VTRPFEHADARRAAQAAFDIDGADSVEVVFAGSESGITRFANSQVIQNTVKREVSAYVRVALGDRVATSSTNQLAPDRVRAAAERAVDVARLSLPDEEWPGAADPTSVGQPEGLLRWDDETAEATPEDRARAVLDIVSIAGSDRTAGFYETSAHAYSVITSTGIECSDAYTRSVVNCLVEIDEATGWGEASSHRYEGVDHEAAADRARDKALRSRDPKDAEPGTYEVVLEPPAVQELLEYLSYSGFGAKQVIEGESFFSLRSGEKVASDRITVADDVSHPLSVGIGFDFDGASRKRVELIAQGIARGPVTDLRTARRLGAQVTGHSSGSTAFGPYAANVVLEPGDETLEELVAGVKRGFLITRFHYVNILDRPQALLTGMTRDGTFEIVDGEVGQGVRNLRFSQSALDALDAVVGIGRDLVARAPEYGGFGSTVSPALRIGEFRFSSAALH
jgi:predicted Zn-dependent protease